ncbi:MAG: ATP-binding protein [Patescibacteria group bacterium]
MTKKNKNNNWDLKKLKAYTEELTNFLPVSFCVVNLNDKILESNKFFEDLTGYSQIDSVGLVVNDLFLEKEEIADLLVEIKKSDERQEKEMTLITKNEDIIPVNVSGVSRKNKKNGLTGYFLTVVNTSKRRRIKKKYRKKLDKKTKKLEEKAKQMEDSRSALLNILEDVDRSYKEAEKERTKTVAIIENFIDGMLFFDENNRLSIINPKAEEFFDIKARDVTDRSLTELATFPTLKPLIKFIKKEETKGVKDLFREELQINEDFYLEVTTTKIEEEENLGTLVHIHDITREKRIERIKSEFVSVAAHQLRTPLSGIKWTLETFLEEAAEEKQKLNEDEETLIRKAYNANERMVNLVNDLLNVSRIEEGRYVYDPETTDIYKVLNPVINDYKETFKEKDGLEFKVNKVKNKLPKVKVDPEKIGIVIQNFLDNAIKYTDEGEVVLSVNMTNDDKIRISVQDDGIGIPEEQQERLFNKFFRAENVQRKDVEGSGLGLFISKNIIEAHGGDIGFNSTEGEGSIFYFTLPITKEQKEGFFREF